jgi:hypothetical protein
MTCLLIGLGVLVVAALACLVLVLIVVYAE